VGAAVEVDGRAGHPACGGGGEEADRLGDIAGCAGASEWGVVDVFLDEPGDEGVAAFGQQLCGGPADSGGAADDDRDGVICAHGCFPPSGVGVGVGTRHRFTDNQPYRCLAAGVGFGRHAGMSTAELRTVPVGELCFEVTTGVRSWHGMWRPVTSIGSLR
jgi:hypothetical protein